MPFLCRMRTCGPVGTYGYLTGFVYDDGSDEALWVVLDQEFAERVLESYGNLGLRSFADFVIRELGAAWYASDEKGFRMCMHRSTVDEFTGWVPWKKELFVPRVRGPSVKPLRNRFDPGDIPEGRLLQARRASPFGPFRLNRCRGMGIPAPRPAPAPIPMASSHPRDPGVLRRGRHPQPSHPRSIPGIPPQPSHQRIADCESAIDCYSTIAVPALVASCTSTIAVHHRREHHPMPFLSEYSVILIGISCYSYRNILVKVQYFMCLKSDKTIGRKPSSDPFRAYIHHHPTIHPISSNDEGFPTVNSRRSPTASRALVLPRGTSRETQARMTRRRVRMTRKRVRA